MITKLHVTTSKGAIIGGSIGGFLLLFIIIIILIKVKQTLPLCLHTYSDNDVHKEDQVKHIALDICNCVLQILVNIVSHLSILCLKCAS